MKRFAIAGSAAVLVFGVAVLAKTQTAIVDQTMSICDLLELNRDGSGETIRSGKERGNQGKMAI